MKIVINYENNLNLMLDMDRKGLIIHTFELEFFLHSVMMLW